MNTQYGGPFRLVDILRTPEAIQRWNELEEMYQEREKKREMEKDHRCWECDQLFDTLRTKAMCLKCWEEWPTRIIKEFDEIPYVPEKEYVLELPDDKDVRTIITKTYRERGFKVEENEHYILLTFLNN
jgi:hypothetical protein